MNRVTRCIAIALALGFAPACDSAQDETANASATKGAKPADAAAPAAVKDAPPAATGANESDEPMSDPTTDNLDPKVAKAAAIAREIEANPSDADSVLQKHGLDRDALDHLMYEIARNPDLSRAYRDARTS